MRNCAISTIVSLEHHSTVIDVFYGTCYYKPGIYVPVYRRLSFGVVERSKIQSFLLVETNLFDWVRPVPPINCS